MLQELERILLWSHVPVVQSIGGMTKMDRHLCKCYCGPVAFTYVIHLMW